MRRPGRTQQRRRETQRPHTTRRRWAGLTAATASLAIAGCGGSSTTSSSGPAPAATSSAATASSSAAPSTTASASSSTAPSYGSGTATTGAATSSSNSSTSASSAANAPDTDVRLPATFTIRPSGALDPPLIAAPKHTDVALTVRSFDQTYSFALLTPRAHRVMVSPAKPARVLLKGIPDGTYPVMVDGLRRGELVIGAAPGP